MEEQSQQPGMGSLQEPVCDLEDTMAELYVDWVYWRGGSSWAHLNLLSCPASLLAGVVSALPDLVFFSISY